MDILANSLVDNQNKSRIHRVLSFILFVLQTQNQQPLVAAIQMSGSARVMCKNGWRQVQLILLPPIFQYYAIF
jgi:hypothetical protein